MTAWIDELLVNRPKRITASVVKPRLTIVTDASGFGWGACRIDNNTGGVVSYAQPWTNEDVRRGASVETETLGAVMALTRFCFQNCGVVELLTDSTTVEHHRYSR